MFWLILAEGKHEIFETVGGRPPERDNIVVLAGCSTREAAEAKMHEDQNRIRPRWG